MKVFAQGSLTRVTMSMREVETMAASWPRGWVEFGTNASATFDNRNGDIVDYYMGNHDGQVQGAIIEKLKVYAVKKGRIPA